MKPEKVIKHVKKEIENIKKHATEEEIGKLDFEKLDPARPRSCIYGQMTGRCTSYRSTFLINKCASRLQNISLFRCGFVKEKGIDRAWGFIDNVSFLESFIIQKEYNNENIIKYLKGESKKLKLTWEE